jgi:hypothetical protein
MPRQAQWRRMYSCIQFTSFSQGVGGRFAPGFDLITGGKNTLPFVQEAEWAQASFWTARRIRLTKIRSPDCPTRSESLYWLRYSSAPGPFRYKGKWNLLRDIVWQGRQMWLWIEVVFKWGFLIRTDPVSSCPPCVALLLQSMCFPYIQQQGRQCTCYITLWRVRITIVAMQAQHCFLCLLLSHMSQPAL